MEFERTPPNDVTAEKVVLGSIMLSSDAMAEVLEILQPEDFWRPAHQTIYTVIRTMFGQGAPTDEVAVISELTKLGEIKRVGQGLYVHELVESVPTATNAGYHAKLVKEQALLRRLGEVGERIAQRVYTPDGDDAETILDWAEAEVYAVAEKRVSTDYVPIGTLLDPTIDEVEAISKRGGDMLGVPTGFEDLDGLTGGLHPGQLAIVAARPAQGKSTLALDFCRAASIKHGVTSAMFSLEMNRTEIMLRLFSAEARINLQHLRSGHMTEADWEALTQKHDALREAPLFIDDSAHMTIPEILAKCRRLRQQHRLGLVVVDYLQLMTSGKKVESRQVEVSEFSRQLKLMAKALNVPVIALSQLNRGPEQRSDHKPMLADLRESGSIEQDSDIVILLHREDQYEKESARAGEADLIVAKHRNGPTATVTVAFQGHYSRFADMAH